MNEEQKQELLEVGEVEICVEGFIKTEDVITLEEADEWVNTERSPEEYLRLHDDLIQRIYNLRGKVEYDYSLAKYKNKYYCTHVHHIDLQAEGGSDDKENLVICTPREHTTLHVLKYRSNPNNYIYAEAACLMANPGFNNGYKGKRLTLEEMQEILKFISIEVLNEIKNISTKAIPVLCHDEEFNVIREFKSVKEACLVFNTNRGTIRWSIKRTKQLGGYYWEYKDIFIKKYPLKYECFRNLKELPKLNIRFRRNSFHRPGSSKVIAHSINTDRIYKIYSSPIEFCKETNSELNSVWEALSRRECRETSRRGIYKI